MWILTNLPPSLTMCTWDALSVDANRMKQLLKNITRCLNHVCLLEQLKNYQDGKRLTQQRLRGPTIWKDVHKKCVERYCELANKKLEQLYKVSNLCSDDHQFKQEEL